MTTTEPKTRAPINDSSAAKAPGTSALGIDLGSLYLKAVLLGPDGAMLDSATVAHRGHPMRALKDLLPRFLNGSDLRLGLTGALGAPVAAEVGLEPVDLVRAIVAAARHHRPDARNVIDVGGASVTLIRLNAAGEFEGLTRNSLCAAGTGSFLDEQATRLGIDYAELDQFPKVDNPPHIATRCAVFAKSDLIHHQQAGRSRVECWSGLCRGMVNTFLSTLLKGRPLSGLTIMTGGVAKNPEIMRVLSGMYGADVAALPEPELAAALGAAMLAGEPVAPAEIAKLAEARGKMEARALASRPGLQLIRSKYPSWEVEENYTDDDGNEVRVTRLPGGRVACYLGVDIGSTSTKLALTDETGDVLCDIYRRTGGDPISATKKLFTALTTLAGRRGAELEVRGAVTTGSGRKMVGLVIGADDIVNEISCHVRGAMRVDPTIDTIFEIGGQDSKYMRTKNGRIRDAAMNFVCAAGTGSFVEEQARKLGFAVQDAGPAVMKIAPPHTSDRCTVFMEQDVNRLLRAGHSREEALAAVLYSVVQNYLNKVVGRRHYSKEKIFFQGATARNPGLVAAFENLLGVEMVVSPYAHVMGAWGAALLAKETADKKGASSFHGLNLADRAVQLRGERCEQCANKCEITFAKVDGVATEPSWGYMCGREPGERKKKVREFRLFDERERLLLTMGKVDLAPDAPKIAVPRALTMYSYLPLWRRFFGLLGYELSLSPTTNAEIKKMGTELAGGDFCFPLKAALGHGKYAAQNIDARFVFIPYMISNDPNGFTSASLFCPYVQSYPSLVRTALGLHGGNTQNFLTPIIDLRWEDARQARELFEKMGASLGADAKKVKKAWLAARALYKEFEAACQARGEEALKEIESEAKPAVIILGRPYNTFDPGINLGLVRKVAERGHTVIPIDFLKYKPEELGEEFQNLFWNFPQRIIHAVKRLRGNPKVYPIYFTNFNCGPDSFVEPYAEYLVGDKPTLTLGMDEHDADAGYITRIEAFLDVVKNASGPSTFPTIIVKDTPESEFRRRKIWIPNMHAAGAGLGAAAFRGAGFDAEALPVETDESFELGRSLTTGNECLPTVVTIGAFVQKLREVDADPKKHAFFMATASGPCRFGQYALKHRLILDELGYQDVPIMSPSSLNSYQGLPEALRRQVWTLFVASDILLKLRCRVKPYEVTPGETQRVFDEELARLARVVESGKKFEPEWVQSLSRLSRVPTAHVGSKPLVGIVGEIYVRCNAFTNDRVIESIERHGGEAWLAPLSEWFLYTAYLQNWRAKEDLRDLVYRGKSLLKNKYIQSVEHGLYEKAAQYMHGREEPEIEGVVAEGAKYLPLNFEGEAILTAGRTVKFIQQGAKLVVNCAPFGCMPGTITSALFQEIQNRMGVPIVNMFYDGEGDQNSILGIYLAQIKGRREGSHDGPRPAEAAGQTAENIAP